MIPHPESRSGRFNYGPAEWKGVSCSWCGSAKPDVLAKAIRDEGATISEADRKYGWPHKFYIKGMTTELPGAQKFYTEHLQDANDEDRKTIERAMGLHFEFMDGRVKWSPFKE